MLCCFIKTISLFILVYCNLLLSLNCLYMSRTYSSLWASWTILNSQPCCKVNLSRSFIFFVALILVRYPRQPLLICLKKKIITWIILCVPLTLLFQGSSVLFSFVQIVNSCCFSNGKDETQTQIPLTSRRKLDRLCFPLGVEGFWVWVSSLPRFKDMLDLSQLGIV